MTATVTNVVRIVSLFVLSQTICVTYTVKYDEKIASEMKVVTNYFTIFFLFLVKSLAISVFSELTASTLAPLQLYGAFGAVCLRYTPPPTSQQQ